MLEEQDHEERGVPVAEQREEVLEHVEEVVAAGDAEEENANEYERGPEDARDFGEGFGEELGGKGPGVDGDAVDADLEDGVSWVMGGEGREAYFQITPTIRARTWRIRAGR